MRLARRLAGFMKDITHKPSRHRIRQCKTWKEHLVESGAQPSGWTTSFRRDVWLRGTGALGAVQPCAPPPSEMGAGQSYFGTVNSAVMQPISLQSRLDFNNSSAHQIPKQ